MKHSKDPFEVAFKELDESPLDSPDVVNEIESQQSPAGTVAANNQEDCYVSAGMNFVIQPKLSSSIVVGNKSKAKEDEDDEEEDNMDVEFGKFPSSSDPDKMAEMQAILSQLTDEEMSRYESFRRSGFQKGNMKKLLEKITGRSKIPLHMNIVVSGIAKMFVGDLVETGRMVMSEREENGPIRPCHIREAYRRLKLENKVPRRAVSRLFR